MVELRPEQPPVVASVAALASQRCAARAARYDETASFPAEDFEDLVSAGLHAPAIPKDSGGLGLGPYRGDVMTLWLMTREIAKADLSMARCWEGHVNSQVLLDGMATTEQKSRWFPGIVERGEPRNRSHVGSPVSLNAVRNGWPGAESLSRVHRAHPMR